jgi:CheY-like chemotaxis protein
LPEHAGICLVALTGYGQPSDRALSKLAGFDAHLVKPVRVEQLLAVLTESRSQRRQTA